MKAIYTLLFTLLSSYAWGEHKDTYRDLLKEIAPSILNIQAKEYTRKETYRDLYQYFFAGQLPHGADTVSLGSGVVWDREGYVVTNSHIIEQVQDVQLVTWPERKILGAKVVGIDRKTGIGLLKVKDPKDAKKLTPLTLGDSSKLQLGDTVFALGNPFGFDLMMVDGRLIAKGSAMGGTLGAPGWFHLSATTNPGNMGGALVDWQGRLMGINAVAERPSLCAGLGIPANKVASIVHSLKAHGKVARVWIGIIPKNILSMEDMPASSSPKGIYGVAVSNVVTASPALKGELKIGDLIMEFDQHKVFDQDNLAALLAKKKAGEAAFLKIYRSGKGFIEIKLTTENLPDERDLPMVDDIL